MGDILRVMLYTNPPPISNENDGNQTVDDTLSICVHSTWWAVHHTVQTPSEAIVFQRYDDEYPTVW